MLIVVFHLLNDYSGSPKVLRNVIERFISEGHSVVLYTSRGGPLDDIESTTLTRHVIPYSFKRWRAVRIILYILSQILSFFAALKYTFHRDTVFYINTVLPIGAAFGARLIGKRVFLHCHEAVRARGGAYPLVSGIMLRLAHHVTCVSHFQASFMPAGLNIITIPNTLSNRFVATLHPDPETAFTRRNVLMLCSLKSYKGIREFLNLASLLPTVKFTLVINDTDKAITRWLVREEITATENVTIHPRQANVAQFYNNASIVVNLSNTRLFVETFGMTALEARACKLPVIVPKIGGIASLITEGVDGYHIDSHDTTRLIDTITNLLDDRRLYMRVAEGVDNS